MTTRPRLLGCSLSFLTLIATLSASAWADGPLKQDWGAPLQFAAPLQKGSTIATARDSENVLWGCIRSGWVWQIARRTDKGWEPLVLPSGGTQDTYGAFKRLCPGPDGSVLTVAGQSDFFLLQLRGNRGRWIPLGEEFDENNALLRSGEAFEDARGKSWFVMGKASMYSIEGPNPATPLLTMGKGGRLGCLMHGLVHDRVMAAELEKDRLGRCWYSYRPALSTEVRDDAKCVIVFEPRKEQSPPPAPQHGVPMLWCSPQGEQEVDPVEPVPYSWEQTYRSFLVPKDKDTMWLGARDREGLYEIDVATFAAKLSEFVKGKPMGEPSVMMKVGDSWLCTADTEYPPLTSLWRHRDGKWESVLGNIDGEYKPFAFNNGIERPWLTTGKGTWIGTEGTKGLVFVPADGSAASWVDASRGFSLPRADTITALPDGHLLFGCEGSPDFLTTEDALLGASPKRPVGTTLSPRLPLAQTLSGDIWMLEEAKKKPHHIKRWENGSWREFAIAGDHLGAGEKNTQPGAAAIGPIILTPFGDQQQQARNQMEEMAKQLAKFGRIPQIALLTCDDKNRLWVFSTAPDGPVSILTPPPIGTPGDGEWKVYATFLDAIIPEKMWDVQFVFVSDDMWPELEVVRGPNNALAFSTGKSIHFYNGTAWTSWEIDNILHKYSFAGKGNPPKAYVAFDEEGRLTYVMPCIRWEEFGKKVRPDASMIPSQPPAMVLGADGTWSALAKPVPYNVVTPPQRPPTHQDVPPPFAKSPRQNGAVADQAGGYWAMDSTAKIWHSAYGLKFPAFPEDAVAPLLSSDALCYALSAQDGQTFLWLKREYKIFYLEIPRPKDPPPNTVVTYRNPDSSTVVLEPAVEPGKRLWFTWSVDDGPWQNAIEKGPIQITGLVAGQHKIQVRAIDESLQIDQTPETITANVVANQTEFEPLIAALKDPDLSKREAASAALAARGEQALPFIKKARETADQDLKWWLDATMAKITSGGNKTERPK